MNRIHVHIIACAAALALGMGAFADSVRLRAAVRIAPDAVIALGDIAELDGASVQALAATQVGRGETGAFTIAAERVRQILVVAGADLRTIEIEGRETIVRPLRGATAAEAPAASAAGGMRVIDPSKEAGTDSALALICEMMRNAFGDDAASLRLECSAEQLANIAPKSGYRYEIVRKTALRASRVEFEVIARSGSGHESRARIRITPKLEREVILARAAGHRGDRINAASIASETRLLDLEQASDAVSSGETQGAAFARSVAAGKVIERADIARSNEIRRRDTVTVRREVGMVAIEFEAVALEDGAIGDVISVERTDRRRSRDNKPLSAEVIGPGRVVIR
jgi:flagella basal body P-ring formation protein FlgA